MIETIFIIVILIFSVILHECAHGWAALRLGDPTAKEMGRLTLNPLKHIDPIGTIILPGSLILLRLMGHNTFIFGWAKPVPVNFARLNHPKRDMMLVAIAGPVTNILIAFIVSKLLIHFQTQMTLAQFDLVLLAVFINLLLAVFNMIPVPPLDGSRIVMGLLPDRLGRAYSQLEPYGIFVVIMLSYLGLFQWIVVPIIEYLGFLLGVKLS